MNSKLLDILPELNEIKDQTLLHKTISCLKDAMQTGGWRAEELDKIPFTLLIPDCKISFLQHVRAVTQVSLHSARTLQAFYAAHYSIDMDQLVAGSVLHDIGKLLEYKSEDQKYQKSESGRYLRHPFSGVAIASKWMLPDKVLHIIATHAKEGDHGKRCPEAVIVHHADFMNFEPLKDVF